MCFFALYFSVGPAGAGCLLLKRSSQATNTRNPNTAGVGGGNEQRGGEILFTVDRYFAASSCTCAGDMIEEGGKVALA